MIVLIGRLKNMKPVEQFIRELVREHIAEEQRKHVSFMIGPFREPSRAG